MTRRLPLFAQFRRHVPTAAPICALVMTLMLGLLLPGCWNPFSSDDDKERHGERSLPLVPRTSPENVLYDFRSIYAGADASVKTEADTLQWGELYQSLFHPDTFTFYFVPGDQPPGWPDPRWGLTDEVNSFQALLLWKVRGTIDDIKLSWTVNPSEPDNRLGGGDPPQLLHPTWRYIYVTGIVLDVVAGIDTYRASYVTEDFYFAPDPADSTLWVVSEWHEHLSYGGSPPSRTSLTRAPLAGSNSTWGRIKGLFYPGYGLMGPAN